MPHLTQSPVVVRHLIRHSLKLHNRLFRTIPFLVFSYFYLDLYLSDEGCWGMIQAVGAIALFLGIIVTGIFALLTAFRKRQTEKIKFEPITLTIVLLTITTLIVCRLWGDNFKGQTWVYAEVTNNNFPVHKHSLTLRQNKNYKVRVNEIEWTCTYTGQYSIIADTIILNNEIAKRTDSNFMEKYLFVDNKLIPIVNKLDTLKRPWRLTKTDGQ